MEQFEILHLRIPTILARESFTSVNFILPAKDPSVPRFVVFTVLATSAAALFAVFLWCRCNRDRQRKTRKAAYRCVHKEYSENRIL